MRVSREGMLHRHVSMQGLAWAHGGKHVLGGVDVPIMADATIRAAPLAHLQRQCVVDVSAGMAPLRTGVPAINPDQRAPIPVRFVLQLPDQLAPPHVADTRRQRGMTDDVLDGQRLYTDHLVLANQARRQLVQAIKALVGNPGMDASDFYEQAGW
jgi:hypothetical protein